LTGLIAALRRRGERVLALKPVVSGYDPADATASDPARILSALDLPLDDAHLEAISPWRFRAALAPGIAARLEGRALGVDAIAAFVRETFERSSAGVDAGFVEGVGGLLSPIAEDATNVELIRALGLGVILVAGTYLGAIGHALATIDAARLHGIPLAALVVNESEAGVMAPQDVAAELARFRPELRGVPLPRGDAGEAATRERLDPMVEALFAGLPEG
jgi:dethiobiotin synthetase